MSDGLDYGRVSLAFRTEPEERLNDRSRLGPQDRVFALLINPLIPEWVRPNYVTIFRFMMTPIVLFAMAFRSYSVAAPLFILLGITDTIDGSLARVRGQVTEWGIVFDGVSDKALVLSVALVLVFREANFWIGTALVAAEGLIIAKAWLLSRKGVVSQANFFGKLKMVCEVTGFSALLLDIWLDLPIMHSFSQVILAAAVIAALISLVWKRKPAV